MTEQEKIGKALRYLRKSNTNYNVQEVVDKIGKSKVWLSELETGKKNVFFKDVLALCKIYNCEISKVIEEMEKL